MLCVSFKLPLSLRVHVLPVCMYLICLRDSNLTCSSSNCYILFHQLFVYVSCILLLHWICLHQFIRLLCDLCFAIFVFNCAMDVTLLNSEICCLAVLCQRLFILCQQLFILSLLYYVLCCFCSILISLDELWTVLIIYTPLMLYFKVVYKAFW